MNIIELKKRLQTRNVREDMYCLDGGFQSEAYCLAQSGQNWEVYYSERGQKSNLKTFYNESSACEYFYNLIMKEIGN